MSRSENTLVGAQVRRNLEIERAAAMVEASIGALSSVVTELQEALVPVLSPEPPVGPTQDRPGGQAPLADDLYAMANRVGLLEDRVRSMIERLS